MLKNALKDTANWQTRRQRAAVQSLKSLHGLSVGELSKVCLQIVLKCLHLARIGRPDILWSVNKLAGAVKKWTQACERLARLISYIHHTSDYRQYSHVGNTAQHCRLGLFQDSDFAGDIEDSTSGGVLCIFGSRTLVPISWMCKKQTSVSHGSKVSEFVSLDAGLRMDGLLALDLWDVVIEVLRSTNSTTTPTNPSSVSWKTYPTSGHSDFGILSNLGQSHQSIRGYCVSCLSITVW